ncbi:MAG: hypothetical protein K1X56_02735 [Flavobacteriales bacterium]|nr:hypothetical protein [Flavobacteriales bacterium]
MIRFLIFCLVLPLSAFAVKKESGLMLYAGDPVTEVFTLHRESVSQLYVLRLHESGAAELNKYTAGKSPKFKQVNGTYSKRKRSIRFSWKNNTESRLFPAKFYIGKRGLYSDLYSAITDKDPMVIKNEDFSYRKPVFIHPENGKLIADKDFVKSLNARDLSLVLTDGLESDAEKIREISRFMVNQFQFAESGGQSQFKLALNQNDPKLNSEGFATSLVEMGTAAGLDVRKRESEISYSLAEMLCGIKHVHYFNSVVVDGEEKILDLAFIRKSGTDLNSVFYLKDPSVVENLLFQQEVNNLQVVPVIQSADPAFSRTTLNRAVLNGDSKIHFAPMGEVRDGSEISVYWMDLSAMDIAIGNEKAIKVNSKPKAFFTSAITETQEIEIPLDGKTNGVMLVESEGIQWHYLVLNGDKKDFYSFHFNRGSGMNLVKNARALVSGILLGDLALVNQFIANTTHSKPYVITKPAMEELKNSLKGWEGEIEGIERVDHQPDLIPEGEDHVYRVKLRGEVDLIYAGDGESGYSLLSIRSPIIKSDKKK